MKHDMLGEAFGLTIAFMAPGLIGLYAASLHAPTLRQWLETVAHGQTTIGSLAIVLIAASGAGVSLSGVRWYCIEEPIRRAAGAPAKHDTVGRRSPEVEAAYQAVRRHHYYFYLFYSNTLVALVVLWLSWLPGQLPAPGSWLSWTTAEPVLVTMLGAAAARVLFASAADAFRRYQEKRAEVLKATTETTPAA